MATDPKALEALFQTISTLRVGVIGDFSLNIHWYADMNKSELSKESPHFIRPIVRERMQPGGAGNVACNFAALQPAQVTAFSVLGYDWRGSALIALLAKQNISTGFLQQTRDRITSASIAPMRQGSAGKLYEDPQLSFENHEALGSSWEEVLLDMLEQAVTSFDVLYVCDHVKYGCITPAIRERLIRLGQEGMAVWVDSKGRSGLYRHGIVKLNESDLYAAMVKPYTPREDHLVELALGLHEITGSPLVVTLGEKGSLVMEYGQIHQVPAYPAIPPVDGSGAGDAFGATAALLRTAGAQLRDAAVYAACSSSLAIQRTAGVVTRTELLERVAEAQAQAVFPVWHH
ncbi:MAG: PfkB family carbohydrate kinase [Clostridia bacterium]|nr:PfkB family carbohydrate kinase [Clostridia bacterium]